MVWARAVSLAVLLSLPLSGFAGAQTAPVLAVVGGTLIDGTGRPPIENSVIIIANGRFTAAGRNGEVSVPQGAQIVDASGKTVLPGFLDGHCHWEDFFGELYLHLGITTCATMAAMTASKFSVWYCAPATSASIFPASRSSASLRRLSTSRMEL